MFESSRHVALSPPGGPVTEEQLEDFSIFSRCSGSLWHLRSARTFSGVIASMLRMPERHFRHDEFVLFVACQLRACGLDVTCPPAIKGANPDLMLKNATKRGQTLWWECKERDPAADREPDKLVSYFAARLREACVQIRDRDPKAAAVVSIDLGTMDDTQVPREDMIKAIVADEMKMRRQLFGVSISGDFRYLGGRGALPKFAPVFRSKLWLSEWAHNRLTGLRLPIRRAIRMFMPY